MLLRLNLRRAAVCRWRDLHEQQISRRFSRQASSHVTGSSSIWKFPLGIEPEAIYDHPELYEMAFSYRDIKTEVKFLKAAYSKHTNGESLNSVVELGCGPALHTIGLARSGVPSCTGIDLNDHMLQYARWRYGQDQPGGTGRPAGGTKGGKGSDKAGKGFASPKPSSSSSSPVAPASQTLELIKADMAAFDLSALRGRCDMIMCLLGTFSHMLDNDRAVTAFRNISDHLRPGGLLVLELAHPGDLFDGTFIIGDSGKEVWEVPVDDSHKILVEWGAEFDNFDPVTQILHRTVSINVFKGDDVEQALEEIVQQRQFTVQEIKLLASMSGLQLEEMYGEMDLEIDLSHEEAYRMLVVLKKL